ncbi:Mif2/CENP-C like-domain-containing protein [Limtongia smithiae]|uniref:Mif2/CENP-C like-domain-containing protein n=1 Tax=Limtongia smithiae TaxID=1125753 RepID=UPI0034CF191B
MENVDDFFLSSPEEKPANESIGGSKTLDTEESMEITDDNVVLQENRTNNNIQGSPVRRQQPRASSVGPLLPRRTPVKTNIGSPARRNESVPPQPPLESIARKLIFSTSSSPAPTGIAVSGKGKSKARQGKPFSMADYDVLEDDVHARREDNDSVQDAETSFRSARSIVGDDEDVEMDVDSDSEADAEKDDMADPIEEKMKAYKELQEREERESHLRIEKLAEKKLQQPIATIKGNTAVRHSKSVTANPSNAIKRYSLPEPESESEDGEEEEAEEDEEEEIEEEVPELSDSEDAFQSDSESERPIPIKASRRGKDDKSKASSSSLSKTTTAPPKAKVAPSRTAIAKLARQSAPNKHRLSSSQPAPSRARTTTTTSTDERVSLSQPSKAMTSVKHVIPKHDEDDDVDGDVRRSKRVRVQPVAFWRNERVVYTQKRDAETSVKVPQIKEIILIDSPAPAAPRGSSTGHHKKSYRGRKAASVDELSDLDEENGYHSDPEEVYADVQDYMQPNTTVSRKIGVSGHAISYMSAASSFKFAKTFDESGFMASGMVNLPPKGYKDVKPSKHNCLTFCVVEGYVEITVQDCTFRQRRGGHFIVPRGNYYSLRNVGDKRALVFFAQATDTLYNSEMARKDTEAN